VRGVGQKEQRMYEHIKEQAKKEGRYGGRAEEVAARTVLKHHKEEHHKKGQ
jgi:hypothetical protein